MQEQTLEDCTELIVADTFYTEQEQEDICLLCVDMVALYMEDHVGWLHEPDYMEELEDHVFALLHVTLAEDIELSAAAEEEMNECMYEAIQYFFESENYLRSEPTCIIEQTPEYKQTMMDVIERLRAIPQPKQRTAEWYLFRNNLITASNAYKALGSDASQNQLMYEKCIAWQALGTIQEEFDTEEYTSVNTTTALHWGQKYEAVSVLWYEYMYETKVEEFGCIAHSHYSFLGASPDGINTDPYSARFGRALEIKNIVNREITGIPKKEYWVQMQLQMEVCMLDECDFLETRFVEYADYTAFQEDSIQPETPCISKDGKLKGILLYFVSSSGKPIYVHKPLDVTDGLNEWCTTTIESHMAMESGAHFVTIIGWKLQEVSCVLVRRNPDWFAANVSQFQHVWDTIVAERNDPAKYELRAPKRVQRESKETIDLVPKCLLTVVKKDSNGEPICP